MFLIYRLFLLKPQEPKEILFTETYFVVRLLAFLS